MNVSQAEITSRIAICETLMVQSEEVEDRRVEVMEMYLVHDRVVAVVIRSPIRKTRLYAAACHPHRECFGIVVPSIRALRRRRATKFPAPKDQRVLQQSP